MGWWKKDQEAQEQGETLPMPRELTDEEKRAQERREQASGRSEDDDLPWWSR